MLQLRNIAKDYPVASGAVHALKEVTVDFRSNEFVAVLGPSGCGKTTLLNILGGLDGYTSGDLLVDGRSTAGYEDADWDAYRNHSVGFVFQSYNLIMHQSVLANVEMALKISGEGGSDRRARATAALEKVGLGDQLDKKPAMLSGGQMQRVAIARALVNDPSIILADEPTGALDSETSVQIMDLLAEVASDRLVIMVTHNPDLAERYASRIIRLKDGRVVSDTNPPAIASSRAGKPTAKPRRTKLGFGTALGLSLNNLVTKKGRTLLTAFAGAIGIIGIALILSLSTGMNDYISQLETDTMGSYPIELEKETFDLSSMMASGGAPAGRDDGEAPAGDIVSNNIVADSVERSEQMSAVNDLGAFDAYLKANYGEVEGSLSAVEYRYGLTPQIMRLDENGDAVQASPSSLTGDSESAGLPSAMASASPVGAVASLGGSASSAWAQLPDDEALREASYTLEAGSWPASAGEAALVIDRNGQVSDYTLYTLGLMDADRMDELVAAVENGEDYDDPQESFSYDDVLGLEFTALAPCDRYARTEGGAWVDKGGDGGFLASKMEEAGVPVRISGVLKLTDDSQGSSGVAYTGDLVERLMDETASSAVVRQQLADPDTNVLTGEAFDGGEADPSAEGAATLSPAGAGTPGAGEAAASLSDDQLAALAARMSDDTPSTYEDVLEALGYCTIDQPSGIALYPADFEGKETIEGFISSYNDQAGSDAEKVTYTDMVGTLTSSLTTIVDTVSYVLIAFTAISLVVSSIMIAIITYISVLERTKEIGVLRAIGASKRDVTSIFNAETFIEGLASGIIGVGATLLICIPINAVVSSLLGVDDIASLPAAYALLLIAVSVALTLAAGYVPARMAAKKDPVVALRS